MSVSALTQMLQQDRNLTEGSSDISLYPIIMAAFDISFVRVEIFLQLTAKRGASML